MTDDRQINEPELRKQIGQVLTDYRNGLLDGLEDGIDAIVAIPEIEAVLKLKVVKPLNLGHSISTGTKAD
jgi:hypothetical protein